MIYIVTPYGEVLSDGNGEAFQFNDEDDARDYLKQLGWFQLFIDLCQFKDWK